MIITNLWPEVTLCCAHTCLLKSKDTAKKGTFRINVCTWPNLIGICITIQFRLVSIYSENDSKWSHNNAISQIRKKILALQQIDINKNAFQ